MGQEFTGNSLKELQESNNGLSDGWLRPSEQSAIESWAQASPDFNHLFNRMKQEVAKHDTASRYLNGCIDSVGERVPVSNDAGGQKPFSLEKKAAEDVKEDGNLNFAARLVAMDPDQAADTVAAINKALKDMGSKQTVEMVTTNTIVDGSNPGRFKEIHLDLKDESGKVISSTKAYDEQESKRESKRKILESAPSSEASPAEKRELGSPEGSPGKTSDAASKNPSPGDKPTNAPDAVSEKLKDAMEKALDNPVLKLKPILDEITKQLAEGKLNTEKIQKLMADYKIKPGEINAVHAALDKMNQTLKNTLGIEISVGFFQSGHLSHINISKGSDSNPTVIGIPVEGSAVANVGALPPGKHIFEYKPVDVTKTVGEFKKTIEHFQKKP